MTARVELIETYLDDLLANLRGNPASVRRMLAETEQHLYAAADEGRAGGLGPDQAAREAIARFGPAAQVARTWNRSAPAQPAAAFILRMAAEMLPLLGIGLLAVGVSGLVARVMTSLWGAGFVFADPPGTRYPQSSCAYWLSIHPSAGSCSQAYLDESLADGLLARYGAGVLGILILVAVAVMHRRWQRTWAPPLLVSFTGAAVFLTAALGLTALGIEALRTFGGNGAGQWLSGAFVALPAAIVCAVVFLRSGRRAAQLS